jgi:L-arabinonolactonase
MTDIRSLADAQNTLGEGPLWDVAEQRLYWIDTMNSQIFRCTADGREVEQWTVPAPIGSLALRQGGGALLAPASVRFQGRQGRTARQPRSGQGPCAAE